jgi:hypothetical protein
MKRFDFLKNLFGTGLLVTALPAELASTPPDPESLTAVGVYEEAVAGFRFYEGPNLLPQLRPGQAVDLVREPGNPHDPRAIAVYWEGTKLGFLPMLDNRVLTGLIDGGVPLRAELAGVFPQKPLWEACRVKVAVEFPSRMLLPVAPTVAVPPSAAPVAEPEAANPAPPAWQTALDRFRELRPADVDTSWLWQPAEPARLADHLADFLSHAVTADDRLNIVLNQMMVQMEQVPARADGFVAALERVCADPVSPAVQALKGKADAEFRAWLLDLRQQPDLARVLAPLEKLLR